MPVVFETAEAPPKKSGVVFDASPGAEQMDALADPSKAPEYIQAQKDAVAVRSAARKERETFRRNNAEAGIPLDIDAELPASMRARLSFESNIDKQVEQFKKRDDVLNARKSKDGKNVIVRIEGENGQPKDVLLHPKGGTLTGGDIAGATAPILKGGAMVGASLATGGLPLATTALRLGLTAAALEAGSSGGSRVLAGQDIDSAELAGAATKEGAINTGMPLAGALVSKGAQVTRNALVKGVDKLERALPDAARRLGVDTTVAETTGSPLLAKVGKLTPAEESARQARLGMAKERAIGPSGSSTVLSEEEIANKTQPIFAEGAETAQKGVRTAMTDAERAAQAQIQLEIDNGIPTTRTTSEVGDFIRNKIASKAATSKKSELQAGAEKLYGAANQMAEDEGIVVAPKAISKLAGEIDNDTHRALVELVPGIKKIPALNRSLTEETVKDTGLLGVTGKPIVDVVPPEPLTVSQARALRSVIYEAAHAPIPGEGGVPKRYLSELYHALDEDLKSAVKSGSKELQAAHSAADDFYKTKIQPLQQSDVAKLFLETDAAGRMGGDEIVRRLFRGSGNLDALQAYRNVLGKDSPEWKLLVRQGLETLQEDAGKLTGKIDAGIFLSRINDLGKNEVAGDIIGPAAQSLRANATLAARAKGVKISVDELEDALAAAPGKVGKLLESAIAREEAANLTYNSTIQKQLRDGILGPRTLGNVDDFVTRFVENASTTDVRQALTQIAAKSPEAVENIRQRVMQNVLQSARVKTPPVGKATTGEFEDMDYKKIMSLLEGSGRDKYKAILGEEGVRFLDDLATYAEATAKRLAGEVGRKVDPATVAKEVTSGAIGFKRNAIGALVDLGATVTGAKKLGSVAVRNPAVREFLETGVLPNFDAAIGGPTTAGGTSLWRAGFAAPAINDAENAVRGQKDGIRILTTEEAEKASPGLFRGTNGKLYEKMPPTLKGKNGKIISR